MAADASRKNGKKGGRPVGSTTRPQLRDYYTPEELVEFFTSLKERAKTDSNIAKFVAEQILGKAPQPLTGHDGGALIISFDNTFATPRQTEGGRKQ